MVKSDTPVDNPLKQSIHRNTGGKMKKSSIFLAVTAALAFIGIASIIGINAFNPETQVNCAGNVASANGSGHNGNLTLSFGAFNHGEGNFTGQATFIDEAAKTRVTIDVECINVNGNIATVGGTVQKSTNPSFISGTAVSFIVQDNGEGAGALPDAFSAPFIGGCGGTQSEEPPLMESDAGNIQVRFVAPNKDCKKCPVGTHCAGNGECVGGGGGGGGISCPVGTRDCCGNCVPELEACPAACEIPK